MRELDCEENWALNNWCFWTVVLEKTLESSLGCKEVQLIHSKGDQSRVFFGRNDAKAETPVLGPPHVKSWITGKVSDDGRDWRQEEKGMTEDEMAGWHHWLPGSSPGGSRVIRRWGRSRRLWKNTYLITDIERLEMDSIVGRLVEKKRLNNLDYME